MVKRVPAGARGNARATGDAAGPASAAGTALLTVMLLTFLLSAIALGIASVIRVERVLSTRFGASAEALYAAEAGLAVTLAEIRSMADWTPVLQGAVTSAASQGMFAGAKRVPAGGTVLLCCAPQSISGRLAAESALSPIPAWRAQQWRPFLWSTLDALVPRSPPSPIFIVSFVRDDEGDGDGNGEIDANGILWVRAEAHQPDGARRAVEAVIERRLGGSPPQAAVMVVRWREVR